MASGIQLAPGIKDRWLRMAFQAISSRRAFAAEFPAESIGFATARRVYRENGRQRWELDARILAHEPFGRIAEQMGLEESAVRVYERVFFHVRPKLTCRDYILRVAVGWKEPWQPRRVRALWCYFAFLGGPDVLDVLLEDFQARGLADYSHILNWAGDTPPPTTVSAALDRCLRAMCLKATPANFVYLQALQIELMKAPRPWQDPLQDKVLQPLIDEALTRTPIPLNPGAVRRLARPKLRSRERLKGARKCV